MPSDFSPVTTRRGYSDSSEPEVIEADGKGTFYTQIRELDRIVLELGKNVQDGFLLVGEKLKPLPIGSTLDREKGKFFWVAGPGFYGFYDFVFIKNDEHRVNIRIRIVPKFSFFNPTRP